MCVPWATAGEKTCLVAHEGVELGAGVHWWCNERGQADELLHERGMMSSEIVSG